MKRADGGKLIAVEGIDGAGKTTQVGLLVDALSAAGESVVRSKEPTDGPWGRKIRQSAARGRMALEDEIEAFIEDRKQHVRELIGPALSVGKTVVLDRYFYSTIAYQGARGGDVEGLTRQMHAIAPEPDLVLLLDVSPEIGLERIASKRGDIPNAFEKLDSLALVRDAFLKLADADGKVVRIDAGKSIEEVHERVMTIVRERVLGQPGVAGPRAGREG